MKSDFTGNSRVDILVTSPWGMGLLGLASNRIHGYGLAKNGTRLGSWLLNTNENTPSLKGDFDGDGKAEVLISSPWGIGLLAWDGHQFDSIAMAQNGTRHGGWIVDTKTNQFLYASDFDGDGKEEILVSSPWGIGILSYHNHTLSSLMLASNGTRFGGWLLNTNDNIFTLVGDFDGDNHTEIVVTSPWGLGILKYNGDTLTSVVMAPNGTKFGDWTLDTTVDRFEVVGDFDGDRKDEILVSNQTHMAILKLHTNHLTSLVVVKTGQRLGHWVIDSRTNQVGTVGDFNGDGKDEILITSGWGMGVLSYHNHTLSSLTLIPNGTSIGGWNLNTHDNRLYLSGDFNGNGKAEILVSSPWGMGVLELRNNTFHLLTMHANGTRFEGWLLNTEDNDLEAGSVASYGVILHHRDWTGAVNNTIDYLKSRGYHIFETPKGAEGIQHLKALSLSLKAGDRIFVYLAGHGNTQRAVGNTDKALSLTHGVAFDDGVLIRYDKFAPSFQLMGNKGIDLTVFDGSCEGGEAVVTAIGERYLALSTTAARSPGLTNTPDPSTIMKQFGKPNMFGLWWSNHYTASLLTAITPHRFYQKIYRSDDTDITMQSLFYKPAIYFYRTLSGGWYLNVGGCYLYQYIYPDEYNALTPAQKSRLTVSTEEYLSIKQHDFDAYTPLIQRLRESLTNTTLLTKASRVYTNAFPRPWQTIMGDMQWDVDAEPIKYSSKNTALSPNTYRGSVGFKRMVNESLNLITLLQQCYATSKTLLQQLDAELKAKHLYYGDFKSQPPIKEKLTDYLAFNAYDEREAIRLERDIHRLYQKEREPFEILQKRVDRVEEVSVLKAMLERDLHRVQQSTTTYPSRGLSKEQLIAKIESNYLLGIVYLDKLFYLLTIVEEAIARAQMVEVESGDRIKY